MRFIFAKHVLWAICSLVISMPAALAHELDDGFVERAVQVRIRDDQLNIEYNVGLTEPTMQQIIESSGAGKHALDTENETGIAQPHIREQFKAIALTAIPESLSLTVDGQVQQLAVESIAEYPGHHYDFVINLSCKLSVRGPADFHLKDLNYTGLDGAVRYALKSSGKTMITRSNASPVIVRAKRHPLGTLKPDERHNACQITATIAVINSEPKD